MTCAFIDDGYTESATLAEIPGVIPAISFDFRPMTAGEMGDHLQRVDKMTEPEARQDASKRMADKIKNWDVRNRNGEPVEIKLENFLKLKQPAFAGLWEIVQARKSGDRLEADAKN